MGNKQKTKGRNVHGILLLDKPAGITSNQALQHVKYLYQARKAGHTGSLDKQATGLLPLCLGEATKICGYLLDSDKYYQATCKLGMTTSTGDAEGEIIAQATVPELTKEDVQAVLVQFLGEISQVPPMHSALKHKGQRLYKLAYQGIVVEREPRNVTIYSMELLALNGDEMEISVRCSKGTYIRTLAEDIGKKLGCGGAHVKKLRRLGAGPFRAEQMIAMAEIERVATEGTASLDHLLLPLDSALQDAPELQVSESLVFYMRQGQAVMVPRAPVDGLVRIYDQQHQFIGVGEVQDDGKICPRRLVQR
jgi:tRNA pseudouridine55 synthase